MGGPRFRILGGPRGAKFPEAHDVVTTSMRRNDVASTSFRRHVPNRFLINQCQIITFLILKYDIIENSRIELREIVLPVQVGGLLGGPKGMLAPPSQIIGGPGPPGPPSSYAYVIYKLTCIHYFFVSKCKSVTGFVLVVHGLERPQHVECKLQAATTAWSSHFHVLRSFQSMHPSHSSGNYYLSNYHTNI